MELEHPVEEEVNLKVEDPGAIPVAIPALVTVITEGLLLDHVPPELGVRLVLPPTQIELTGLLTVGRAKTVTEVLTAAPAQPPEVVSTTVTEPEKDGEPQGLLQFTVMLLVPLPLAIEPPETAQE